MQATAEGTERYVARYPAFRDAATYRTVLDLRVCSLGIGVVASATLSQTRVLREMPARMAEQLPDLSTDAQCAIQFTRSTPGTPVALAGMGRTEHVAENLGVAMVPPLDREAYQRLYRQ
jgi:aryl-alcohol dehydrogenase-like predicted oxidoreductase